LATNLTSLIEIIQDNPTDKEVDEARKLFEEETTLLTV
jgi:hypothetical protein